MHFGDLRYISRLESALGLEGAGFEVLLSYANILRQSIQRTNTQQNIREHNLNRF